MAWTLWKINGVFHRRSLDSLMGTTESTSMINSKSNIHGLAVPSFSKYLCRIILTILVGGGSYLAVGESLRFLSSTWHDFKVSLVDAELDGQVIEIGDKGLLTKDLPREQLEKHLYSCVDSRLKAEMKLAAVQDLISN